MAPFNINPQIIMWDPATYPQVKAIKDLKPLGVKVRYFGGAAYMDYLIQSGQLDKGQTDGSYDGTPANFVAAGGKDAQQGFASRRAVLLREGAEGLGQAHRLPADPRRRLDRLRAVPGRHRGQLREVRGTASRSWCRSSSSRRSTTSTTRRGPTRSSSTSSTQYNNGWQYDEGQAKAVRRAPAPEQAGGQQPRRHAGQLRHGPGDEVHRHRPADLPGLRSQAEGRRSPSTTW